MILFCFNGSSLVPYFGLGYEGIFEGPLAHLFNPQAKIFLHNKAPMEWDIKDNIGGSLGVGLDFQGHIGTNRQAGSLGLALRYLFSDSGSTGGLLASIELSLRGGIGGFGS